MKYEKDTRNEQTSGLLMDEGMNTYCSRLVNPRSTGGISINFRSQFFSANLHFNSRKELTQKSTNASILIEGIKHVVVNLVPRINILQD